MIWLVFLVAILQIGFDIFLKPFIEIAYSIMNFDLIIYFMFLVLIWIFATDRLDEKIFNKD